MVKDLELLNRIWIYATKPQYISQKWSSSSFRIWYHSSPGDMVLTITDRLWRVSGLQLWDLRFLIEQDWQDRFQFHAHARRGLSLLDARLKLDRLASFQETNLRHHHTTFEKWRIEPRSQLRLCCTLNRLMMIELKSSFGWNATREARDIPLFYHLSNMDWSWISQFEVTPMAPMRG